MLQAKQWIVPKGGPFTLNYEPSWNVTIPFGVMIHAETEQEAVDIAYALAEWTVDQMQDVWQNGDSDGFVIAVDCDDRDPEEGEGRA